MNIYIIYIVLFLLIISLFYIINKIFLKKNTENFVIDNNVYNLRGISNENVRGVIPNYNKSSWNLLNIRDEFKNEDEYEKECNIDDIGNICSTENGFGIINKNCLCITKNLEKEEEKEKEEEEEEEEDENKCKNIINNMIKNGKLKFPSIYNNELNKEEEEEEKEEEIDFKRCYPNNTNFEQICKNINPNYVVQEIIRCDNNNSRVDCDNKNNIKNIDGLMITPCLYKNEDFDNWCRYFNSNNIPKGYNINSVGSIKILPGKLGNCNTNGNPDTNKARAICGYNSMESIKKLEPINNIIGYNKFTECLPLKNKNFKNECSKILKTNISNSNAIEIMGYDCNPHYARAKCIHSNDKSKINGNFLDYNQSVYNTPISSNNLCS